MACDKETKGSDYAYVLAGAGSSRHGRTRRNRRGRSGEPIGACRVDRASHQRSRVQRREPGDWIELTNTGTAAVDLSSWVLKDNDDSHVYTIASGTTLAPGAFKAFDVDATFGLGSSDSARLYQPGGSTLVDSYSWTSHASTTYGRCADGTGAFVTTVASTKGAANSCPPPAAVTWPGGSAVATADTAGFFGTNLSGLSYESASVVWAIKNGPSTLYRLIPNGALWKADTANSWSAGKALHYQSGSGDPDAEGVVVTADGILASTERDNDNDGTSLLKVLRFDPNATGATLTATAEWNLTSDLPAAAANSGLEGIAWVPDSVLTAASFHDEHTNAVYAPSSYPNHGTGLYFVASEATGTIYAYALNLSGTTLHAGRDHRQRFRRRDGSRMGAVDQPPLGRVRRHLFRPDLDPGDQRRGHVRRHCRLQASVGHVELQQ